jgi:hypothetical protein
MAFPEAGVLWQVDLPICLTGLPADTAIGAAYACIFGMGRAAALPFTAPCAPRPQYGGRIIGGG